MNAQPETRSVPRPSAADWLRSWAFAVAYFTWTTFVCIVLLPCLLSKRWATITPRIWVKGLVFWGRVVARVDYRLEGLENLPSGPCIVASEHQSSYETYLLMAVLNRPIFVLKRELMWIPFVGWYMRRSGMIGVDRGAGGSAMRQTLRGAKAAFARGRQLIIFPQGTRTPRGVVVPYRPGIAALYLHAGVPVIPVALNSGYCWGKSRILKRPGIITFRFLPALPPGLDKDAMLTMLQQTIEDASRALPDPPG